MRHPFVGDVNDLFDEINRAVNLRLQSEQYRRFSNPSREKELWDEHRQLMKSCENMVYELIDDALRCGEAKGQAEQDLIASINRGRDHS